MSAFSGNTATLMTQYIHQKNWIEVETITNASTGCIGPWGGRYMYCVLPGAAQPMYLEAICWAIFDRCCKGTNLKDLSKNQLQALNNVLVKLGQMYDETEAKLNRSRCSVASIATRLYDLGHQVTSDGYPSGIDRLNDILANDVRDLLSSNPFLQEVDNSDKLS